MEIGIRKLRDVLRRYLAEVRSRHAITVTDHSRAIARIVPVDRPTRLEQLRAEGRVEPARRRKRPAPDPVPATGTASDLIGDQRR